MCCRAEGGPALSLLPAQKTSLCSPTPSASVLDYEEVPDRAKSSAFMALVG